MTVEQDGPIMPEDKEAEFQRRYTILSSSGSPELSSSLADQTKRVLFDVFGQVYRLGAPDEETALLRLSKDAERIKYNISLPSTQFVGLVSKAEGKLVGFSYAVPSVQRIMHGVYYDNPFHNEYRENDLSTSEFNAREERTAEVSWTMIHPDHRGKGGWRHMMDALESRLVDTGKYDWMTRYVRTANDYANGKFRGRYADRIVYEYPENSYLGPRRYFRVALPQATPALTA